MDQVTGDGRARSPDELWAGLVVEIAAMPDVVANLLHEHQPDEQGFCTGNGCGTAGRGVPTTRWPCSLHTLATDAKESRETGTSRRAPAPEERTQPTRPPMGTAVAWVLRGR